MKDPLPAIRSVKAAVVGTLAVALPFLFLLLPGQAELGPLPAFYAVLMILYLLPVALCMVTMLCGVVPMGMCLAVALGTLAVVTGKARLAAVTLAGVYLLPVVLSFCALVYFRVPFKKSCLTMIGVHVAALTGVYLLCQHFAGGNLYAAAGNITAEYLQSWEYGDQMLYQAYAMGLIGLKEGLGETAVQQSLLGFQLSEAARADMLLSIRSMVTTMLQNLIPSLLAGHSVYSGVGCLLLSLRFGYLAEERRQFLRTAPEEREGLRRPDFPTLDMPPFDTWYMPRSVGWQVGGALVVGYGLQMSGAPALRVAGQLCYAAASALFSVQGLSTVNYLQKYRGSGRPWRVIAPVLLLVITPIFPMLLGIFDQINNFRGLRRPPEAREEL